MTNIWTPTGNRVAALPPALDDLFVLTLIEGKRVTLHPVADFEKALGLAEAFARSMTHIRPFTVKVLSLSLPELLAFIGMTLDEFASGMSAETDAELRQLTSDACLAALRESSEPNVRTDALEVLTAMGVMKPC